MDLLKRIFFLFPVILCLLHTNESTEPQACSKEFLDFAKEVYSYCGFFPKLNFTIYKVCMLGVGYDVAEIRSICSKKLEFSNTLKAYCTPDKKVLERFCCVAETGKGQHPNKSSDHFLSMIRMCIDETTLQSGYDIVPLPKDLKH